MATGKAIRVYSHPRSGTHLMMHTLKRNFYPDVDLTAPGGLAGHWADRRATLRNPVGQLFGGHGPWNKRMGPCIYMYRDGRDVAVALWLAKETMHPDRRDMPFSEFFTTPLDWLYSPGHRAAKKRPVQTIAEHWRRHLEAWEGRTGWVAYVRYEQLVSEPAKIIGALSDFFSLPMPNEPQVVEDLVGNWPDGGKPGMWRQYFGTKDLQFFHRHVPEDFWGLWP